MDIGGYLLTKDARISFCAFITLFVAGLAVGIYWWEPPNPRITIFSINEGPGPLLSSRPSQTSEHPSGWCPKGAFGASYFNNVLCLPAGTVLNSRQEEARAAL